MAVAVLNRNEPAFYCVPARAYEELMDLVDDLELGRLADARLADGQELVRVSAVGKRQRNAVYLQADQR